LRRTRKARKLDESLRAPKTEDYHLWVHAPNEYDVVGVDTVKRSLKADDIDASPYTHAQVNMNQIGGIYRVDVWDKDGKRHVEKYLFTSEDEAKKFLQKVKKENEKKQEPTIEIIPQKKKGVKATYNIATGWVRIVFDEKPSRETLDKLKAEGFRYRPKSRAWTAKQGYRREELLRELAGTVEDVNIPINYEGKAEYYAEKAERTKKEADERYDKAKKLMNFIPIGQPILVGHHSEKRHRRDLKRIDKGMKTSFELSDKAEQYERTAENYKAKSKGTENPRTVKNRITNLEKDIKRLKNYMIDEKGEERKQTEKQINRLEHLLEQQRKQYKKTGGVLADVVTFKPGMVVHTTNGKARIKKVSGKSVRVELITDAKSLQGPPWNNLKIDKDKILKVYNNGS